jgi:hypothetical protein
MAMQMQQAFDAQMLTKMVRVKQFVGFFNSTNDWIKGSLSYSNIWGVIQTGNKFSQFDEGIALRKMDGGDRFSDYRSLHVTDRFALDNTDKVFYKGKHYNVLQQSDESEFGFHSYLLELSEEFTV